MLIIPDSQEVEIKRITVPSQLRQNVNETTYQQNEVGMVANACNPRYRGGFGRRIVV
jgi:hypothetical protein